MSNSEEKLKQRIAELERRNAELVRVNKELVEQNRVRETDVLAGWESPFELTKQHIERYSRHLILPSFGPEAQARLINAKVLVIGAGGLGSAALLYLAGAGVGHLGIIDRDEVALSNLHRQVLHREDSVGLKKTDSAKRYCLDLNSSIQVKTNTDGLSPENAIEVVTGFDVVIDASDNIPTRYLASDVCKVLGIPLVSGAAIGTDGHLTVYNYGLDGPCYRCLIPKAPAIDTCKTCSESGVLGPVPGVIGTLQALEAIKIIAKVGKVLNKRLLFFDFLSMDTRCIRLRGKRDDCVCCGVQPTITRSNLAQYDYQAFTGQSIWEETCALPLNRLPIESRITPTDLVKMMNSPTERLILLDVRPEIEFKICHLKGSMNFPIKDTDKLLPSLVMMIRKDESRRPSVVVMCKRGNDSQTFTQKLIEEKVSNAVDLIGGLESWHDTIDPSFPIY